MLLGTLWRINFLLIICHLSFADSMAIKGTLFEKGTKKRLNETNIFILPHKLKATTNSKGQFFFPDVPAGEIEFIINKTGYIKLAEKKTADVKEFKLYLEREFYDVFETVVVGQNLKKDVAKKTLSQKDFLKAPGAQEDPVKAVQNLPGVANQSFGPQIVVQGSEPDDTSYAVDGHDIPLIFHFGGLTSVVNPRGVEEVEYLAAGYGPEFGRALGGIINLKTKGPRTERWFGEGFIDLTQLGALVEGPINKKSSFTAGARVSYFGKIVERIAEDMDDFGVTAAPEYQDFYTKYVNQLSKNEKFSLVGLASKDTLDLVIKEGDNPIIEGDLSNKTSFTRFIPRYQKKVNERLSYDLSLAIGEDNLNFNIGDQFFDLGILTSTQRMEWMYRYNEVVTGIYGVDSKWSKFDLDIRLPNNNNDGGVGVVGQDSIAARITGENWELGHYVRHMIKISEKWNFSPNIRHDYFSAIEKSYLSARGTISYQKSDSLVYHFAYGEYYQAPKNGEGTEDFGNPDVIAEKAQHYLLSLNKDFRGGSNQGLLLDTGVFYKELDDLIVSTPEVKSDGTPVRVDNDGEGSVVGAQLQLSLKYKEYTLLGAYTYMQSRRKDPVNGEYPSQFDQTHNLNLIGVYELSRWSFATRVRYVTGNPYTPILGAVFNSDKDVFVPTRGEFFTERFDDFIQLDFRVDRKFIYKTWILSTYLDIQNLTNANNGQGITYNFDYSENERAAGTPIIPIFGLRGEF